MKKLCLVLGFMVFLTESAQAATPLVDHFDAPAVTAALTNLGATGVKVYTLDGEPGLLAQTADGLSMGLYARACPPTGAAATQTCRGIEAIVGYDPGAGADRALLADKLNHDFAAGKFMVERDGSIRLSRYLDLTGGVSAANLQAELSDFFAVASAAKQTLWAPSSR